LFGGLPPGLWMQIDLSNRIYSRFRFKGLRVCTRVYVVTCD